MGRCGTHRDSGRWKDESAYCGNSISSLFNNIALSPNSIRKNLGYILGKESVRSSDGEPGRPVGEMLATSSIRVFHERAADCQRKSKSFRRSRPSRVDSAERRAAGKGA